MQQNLFISKISWIMDNFYVLHVEQSSKEGINWDSQFEEIWPGLVGLKIVKIEILGILN